MGVAFAGPQGYFVDLRRPLRAPRYPHVFCGIHGIPGAFCATCRRPLLRFLSLDPRDSRLSPLLSPLRLIRKNDADADTEPVKVPLLFCWTCRGEPLAYRLLAGGNVQVIGRVKGHGPLHPPYPRYPLQFPRKSVGLIPIRRVTQDLIHRSNSDELASHERFSRRLADFLRPRHQVGGEPYLVQGTQRNLHEPCGLCSRQMPILAAIGDDSGTRKGFIGNPFAQVIFHYCTSCRFMSAYHECD